MESAPRPYHALRHTDFRRFWTAQTVSLLGTQMQVAAIDWHVYLLTGSPLALGLVGLVRVVPIVLFSLWGGVLADRGDRRRILLATQALMALGAAVLGWITWSGHDTVAALYLLTALSAGANAFDSPARQSLVPGLVPRRDLPGALSLNLTSFQAALIGGPALAGLVLAGGAHAGAGEAVAAGTRALASGGSASLAAIYVFNAVSFAGVLLALVALRGPARAAAPASAGLPPLRSLQEGLRFVFRTPIMVWTMTLDFVATFFSGANSLLPIFADRILHVGAFGYGWLRAAAGLGALLASLLLSVRPLPRRQGALLLSAVGAYGAATVVFGLSRSYALTFVALAATGVADLVSTVVRQTLRQLVTPDELRGRMTAVNMIFFTGGPQLGELEAGLVAWLFTSVAFGATFSVVSGGLATIAIAGFVAARGRVVREYDVSRHLEER